MPLSPLSPGHFVSECRLCHSRDLHPFLDFGLQPHSDGFLDREALTGPEPVFPLAVALCAACGQVQLTYAVSPAHMWGTDYAYDSSITETGRKHFIQMADDLVDTLRLPPDALAVDIGSNVGLLLSGFQARGLRVQGVDPAPEPVKIALSRGIPTKQELFSLEAARAIVTEQGRAAVITGTNVFAHVDDLDALMLGVDALLEENGVFVIEAPYFADTVEHLEYDTIYHQHASYLAITPLMSFFRRFDMTLFDVVRTTIHGGSIRLFVCRNGVHTPRPIVDELTTKERQQQLLQLPALTTFATRVHDHRTAFIQTLVSLKDEGKRIAGLSAPAKGNTLLNFCGINASILDFITEKNTMKIGRFTPGSRIEILPDSALMEHKPDVAVILAWNFAAEIMRNQAEYKAAGGTFLLPIPHPTFV